MSPYYASLNKSGGWGPRVGDLVEFLAYGGMRISSEAVWVDWEDVDWERKEIIVRGHPETGTKNSEIRRVPMISDMDELLQRLKQQAGGTPTGHIMKVGKCNEALARACNEIGISKLTHHDLRHLFATRCIEAGVDIPTVARWMGHKDGGALAMKTYGACCILGVYLMPRGRSAENKSDFPNSLPLKTQCCSIGLR